MKWTSVLGISILTTKSFGLIEKASPPARHYVNTIVKFLSNMTNEVSFDINVENKEKLMELFAQDGVETIYIEKVNGELFPVANIERHPDCPKHIYEAWIRSLVQWNH